MAPTGKWVQEEVAEQQERREREENQDRETPKMEMWAHKDHLATQEERAVVVDAVDVDHAVKMVYPVSRVSLLRKPEKTETKALPDQLESPESMALMDVSDSEVHKVSMVLWVCLEKTVPPAQRESAVMMEGMDSPE